MLQRLLRELRSKNGKENYRIPGAWIGRFDKKELIVNPYKFFVERIESILEYRNNRTEPLNSTDQRFELRSSVFYSALLRTTTSYPHSENFEPIDKNHYRNSGTFLKTIALLPYLKTMGINILYLLPISKYSNSFKKGEIGSPYSVKNFLKIDPNLRDPLSDMNVEGQFTALVEACHTMNIKVIIDFIPRTAARDNELILKHPEWFYWIRSEFLKSYKPPKIENLGFVQPSKENLQLVYTSKEVKKHLKMFSQPPNLLNKEKWEKFVRLNTNNPEFIQELQKEFKVVTPPGFSDWINDTQPTWNDITFLRLYLSHPKESIKYLPKDQAPYILFDVIKSSKFPGERKNEDLWNYLSDIIPFYQRTYGIDGVRIDMGHALPKELEHSIIKKAKEIDPNFIFIAEELEISNDKKAKKSGYNAILGNSWWVEPRIEEGEMEKFITEITPRLSLLTFATAETPDTPRAVTRKYGKLFSKFSAVLNAFLPNTIEMVNSGFEFYEIQPMNLGLDNNENGKYVLDKNDPFYGKLAFFDHYCLHWQNDFEIYKLLKYINKIKSDNTDLISVENLRTFDTRNNNILYVHYQNERKGLLLLINKNFKSPENLYLNFTTLRLLDGYKESQELARGITTLKPGEITLLTYEISEINSVIFKVEHSYLKPHKKYYSDAGWDLKSKVDCTLKPGESSAIPTGTYCAIPTGYVGLIKPRSGLAIKYGIDTMAGVIDSGYRGEIKIVLINHGKNEFKILKGDRIAQIIIVKILLDSKFADNLNETLRNSNGFGSTGRN